MKFWNYLSKNLRKTLQRESIQFPKAWPKGFPIHKGNAYIWEKIFWFDHDIGLISSKICIHGHPEGGEFQLGVPGWIDAAPGRRAEMNVPAKAFDVSVLVYWMFMDIYKYIFVV